MLLVSVSVEKAGREARRVIRRGHAVIHREQGPVTVADLVKTEPGNRRGEIAKFRKQYKSFNERCFDINILFMIILSNYINENMN